MEKRRMGDVMPLELAMRRELAHRKKVETLLCQLYGGESPEDTFTPQVPPSSPSSGQSLLGTKRKTLGSSSQSFPPELQPLYGSNRPGKRTDDLFCKVCQVTCPSSFHLKQHLTGRKHKDTLALIVGRNIGEEEEANTREWCEFCKIWCMNKYSLRQHFMGKKHQDKVEKLKLRGKEAQGKTVQVKQYCELCEFWCMDEYAFDQHIKGKKHIINLHAFEEKRTEKGKEMAVDRYWLRKN